jgi:hypothetical protein
MKKYRSRLAFLALLFPLSFTALAQQTPVIKMVDCNKDKENLKCKRLNIKQAGSIGEGPAFYQGIGDEITGGYLHGDKLTVSSAILEHGAIIEVDLQTGSRTLISGSVDTSESKGENVKYKDFFGKEQSTYDLEGVANVRPLPNGNYAASIPTGHRLVILEVEAKTGNRKLLWASNVSSDASRKTFENLPSTMFCESSGENDNRPNIGGFSFEVAKDGSLYVFARENPINTGIGLFQIKDGTCKAISAYSSSGAKKAGSGYMLTAASSIDTSAIVTLPDGKLLSLLSSFTAGYALMTWDPSNGNRELVSFLGRTIAKTKGKGDDAVGNSGLAINSTGIYTTKRGSFELIKIDPKTGDRTRIELTSGPLSNKGGRLDGEIQQLWAIPNSDLLLLSFNNAIIVVDPKSGMSNVLSY